MPNSVGAVTYDRDRQGQRLGGYVLETAVAEGSMGRIYRAHDAKSGHRVALKVLHAEAARDPVAVERFRREHETAASLRHPHIVEAYDFGETGDGSYFMTMEYLDGEDLGSVLKREGAFGKQRMVRVLCQLAMGLEHAHRDGVVHRDLKPANIFLCPSEAGDDVRIVDFGSVKLQVSTGPKLTTLGTTLGSPYYMSPEQAMGQLDLDARSDVFALAAITHELCTGKVAFGGDTAGEILAKITGDDPPPISTLNRDYPWSLDDVVKRALRKEKAGRHPGALSFAEAVLGALGVDGDVAEVASSRADGGLRVSRERPVPEPVPDAGPRSSSIPPLPARAMPRGALALAVGTGILAVGCAIWLLVS